MLWRKRNKSVHRLKDNFLDIAASCDVVINFNGANIHPEWLRSLTTFKVYVCWHDPSSSHLLSQPVAKYFDFAFTGNASCVQLYKGWGIHRCDFLPYCCPDSDRDQSVTADGIMTDERDIDIVISGINDLGDSSACLNKLQSAFPQAILLDCGWPEDILPNGQKLSIHSRAKVGINLHESVGPLNPVTYVLPGNGVLLIGDNKYRLGRIFELEREALGFDTIDECIELARYYLSHERERREIAARGVQRVMRDYTEEKQWERLLKTIEPYVELKLKGKLNTPIYKNSSERPTQGKSFLAGKVESTVKRALHILGFDIKRLEASERQSIGHNKTSPSNGIPYEENPEVGPANWSEKLARVAKGENFEWPNMVALNWAVATLVGPARKIVELGGGTGCFAYEISADPKRIVVCSDLDTEAIRWARKNRSRKNIKYLDRSVTPYDGPFDLLVAIDVIEHLQDYRSFLETCVSLAPRAIITTPNKSRDQQSDAASPPSYYQHVREWTAGEFYWVLKAFYQSVKLYAMPNIYIPQLRPIKITDSLTPLVAACEQPYLRVGHNERAQS
jgi:2-polyprenyl-3-methyl-5-hydroxy-6-metoxy-1,4-benzoquinol methylase